MRESGDHLRKFRSAVDRGSHEVTILKRNERSFTVAGLEPKKFRRPARPGTAGMDLEERGGPWIEAARPDSIGLRSREVRERMGEAVTSGSHRDSKAAACLCGHRRARPCACRLHRFATVVGGAGFGPVARGSPAETTDTSAALREHQRILYSLWRRLQRSQAAKHARADVELMALL